MLLSIVKIRGLSRSGFTIAETLITLIVAVFVITAAISVYMMAWQWWSEIAPRVDAQKIARVAISSIVDGRVDPTAGTYTVGAKTYGRRDGIAWATATPDMPSSSRINFMLNKTGESSNIRSFYLATDAASQLKAVYYIDSNNAVHMIRATLGITDLKFERYLGYNNLIKVTATVQKTVSGTRKGSYPIKAEYSETIYLRSVASL